MNRDLHHIIMLGEMAGAVSTMITGTGMTPLGGCVFYKCFYVIHACGFRLIHGISSILLFFNRIF